MFANVVSHLGNLFFDDVCVYLLIIHMHVETHHISMSIHTIFNVTFLNRQDCTLKIFNIFTPLECKKKLHSWQFLSVMCGIMHSWQLIFAFARAKKLFCACKCPGLALALVGNIILFFLNFETFRFQNLFSLF